MSPRFLVAVPAASALLGPAGGGRPLDPGGRPCPRLPGPGEAEGGAAGEPGRVELYVPPTDP